MMQEERNVRVAVAGEAHTNDELLLMRVAKGENVRDVRRREQIAHDDGRRMLSPSRLERFPPRERPSHPAGGGPLDLPPDLFRTMRWLIGSVH